MRLFLIRHGETVDNVAGVYAGVQDSALTNHGAEQIARLGAYFAKTGVKLTRVFSSPLQRAHNTAEALLKAQDSAQGGLQITKVQDLIEQDFGFYEGKSFHTRQQGSDKTEREAQHDAHKDEPGFVDVESRESMAKRCDSFLDEHLLPLFDTDACAEEHAVGVVSHGILLANLWRRLLLRLPRNSLTVAPEVMAARGNIVLEHLGGWSNTGYLELSINKTLEISASTADALRTTQEPKGELDGSPPLELVVRPLQETQAVATNGDAMQRAYSGTASWNASPQKAEEERLKIPVRLLAGCVTVIVAVDNRSHLVGLKRQRGGIGSLKHDVGQKKLDGFFKRQKIG